MLRLQLARTAIMALTAISLIWTTTAHAAQFDNDVAAVYGNPVTDPGSPTVPGGTGSTTRLLPDLKMTFVSDKTVNGIMTWNYRVENLGPVPAQNVWVRKSYNVFVFELGASHYDDALVQPEKLGDMAPGAKKDFHIICVPMPGAKCHMSSAQVLLDGKYHADANPNNDWITSADGK